MKIGITERGDAGIDLTWVSKLTNMDGTILITKKITDAFMTNVMQKHNEGHKIVLHCTCTGWGASPFEPNVPDYKTQLNHLKELLNMGFPAENCVLRIDPIFPTTSGLKRVQDVLNYFQTLHTGITRIRISVYDEYNHVKERLRKAGYNTCYNNTFYASYEQMEAVASTLAPYPYTFETCAEDMLVKRHPETFQLQGCVSKKELELFGITIPDHNTENGQNRSGCHCLICKTELLENKRRCPNQCIYCYWRD